MIIKDVDEKTDAEILEEIMERNKEGLQRLAAEERAEEMRDKAGQTERGKE